MTDQEIISLILAKDEKGLSALYDKYASVLYGVILRVVGEQHMAEDILSSVMLKVWNKMSLYDKNKSALYTWLYQIATNSAIDKTRLKSYSNRNKTTELNSNVQNIKGETHSFNSIDVERLVGKLDEKYKVVLEKMYLEGYSQSDIAKLLDIPLGTVKTRLRKAILILREDLKTEEGLFLGFVLLIILILLS